MSREYETAPDVAMGVGTAWDADSQLYVRFEKRPVLDELLSYGWQPGAEVFTLSAKHPRFTEMKARGRIEEEDPEHRGMYVVTKTDVPIFREGEFVIIMRRGQEPSDVLSNAPEVLLCDHPAGKRCPITPSGVCHKNRFRKAYEAWKAGQEHELADGLPLSEIPFIEAGMRENLRARGVFTAEQLIELSEDVATKLMGLTQLQARVRKFLAAVQGQRDDEKLAVKLAERDDRIAALERQLAEMKTAVPSAPPVVAQEAVSYPVQQPQRKAK